MKSFKQFLEYTQSASDFNEKEKWERAEKKRQEKMKQDITADVMDRLKRQGSVNKLSPNPNAN